MYQIAYIGRWETLPETAAAICDHDTPKLEALLQGGLDLGAPIQLSEYIKLMPLEIAVFRNDVPMIHFLLEHGADPGLAEEQPLLLTAARCCGPEVVTAKPVSQSDAAAERLLLLLFLWPAYTLCIYPTEARWISDQ